MAGKIIEKKIRNKKAVLTGTAFFYLSVLYLSEIFQYLLSSMFSRVSLEFNYVYLSNNYEILNSSNFINFIILLSDIFFIMITVEIAYNILKKLAIGFWRYVVILFIVLSLGFIILDVFYGFFSIIVHNSNNDWTKFFVVIQASFQERIIYSLGFILTTFLYLNLITRRIIKYIKN